MSDRTATRIGPEGSAPDRRDRAARLRAGGGGAPRGRAGSGRRCGPPRGTITRRWASRPGTPLGTTSTGPARSASSAPAAAASSSSTGARFQATRTPPGATQRQPELDELRERGDRPGRDRGPRLPVTAVAGDAPRPARSRPRPAGPRPVASTTRPQEPDLLGHRVHEQRAVRAERDRQREPREPAARPDVQQPRSTPARGEARDGGERVQDVEPRHERPARGSP